MKYFDQSYAYVLLERWGRGCFNHKLDEAITNLIETATGTLSKITTKMAIPVCDMV